MLIRLLPLLGGVIPVVAVTIAYWLGADSGVLPTCNPWLDGCTSISATGRHPPGSYLFRAVEMPLAPVLAIIWYFCAAWLKELCGGGRRVRIRVIFTSGIIAAAALIVYVTFLGTSEPIYEFMRRFGIYGFFLGTALAQLLLSLTLVAQTRGSDSYGLGGLPLQMLVLAILPFLLGVLNLLLKALLDDADAWENSIEWIASLMMQAWFVLLYVAWRRSGFRVVVTVN